MTPRRIAPTLLRLVLACTGTLLLHAGASAQPPRAPIDPLEVSIIGDRWFARMLAAEPPAGCTRIEGSDPADGPRALRMTGFDCGTFTLSFAGQRPQAIRRAIDEFIVPVIHGGLDTRGAQRVTARVASAQDVVTVVLSPTVGYCDLIAARPDWAEVLTSLAQRTSGTMLLVDGRFYGSDGLGEVPGMVDGAVQPRLRDYAPRQWLAQGPDCRS